MSLTKVSYSMITGAPVNVLDFGADPTGVTDSTAAFNDALQATIPFAQVISRTVYVPPGTYKISSTLFVRAGCTLEGAGGTSSAITSDGATISSYIKIGHGLINNVVTNDGSGLVPQVFGLYLKFGVATGIDCAGQSGYRIFQCWFSLSGTAINAGGSDGLITDCLVDTSTFTGIQILGSRHIISDCIFTNPNFGIVFSTPEFAKVSEIKINNCQFFACSFISAYLFSSTIVKDISFTNCIFTTSVGVGVRQSDQKHFNVQPGAAYDFISFNGCRFENVKQNDFLIESGTTVSLLEIDGCSFFNTGVNDGGASNALQHSIVMSAAGILNITGCTFDRVGGQSIRIASGTARSRIVGCHNYNCGQGGAGLAAEPIVGDRANFHFRNGGTEHFVGDCTTDINTLFVAGSFNSSNYTASNCKSQFTFDTQNSTTGGSYIGCRHFQDGTFDVVDIVGTSQRFFAAAAPASGTYAVGDIVWNNTPVASGTIGFVCVTAGTPGTWKTFGAISA